MKTTSLISLLILFVMSGFCQVSKKDPRRFGVPVVTDSLSTIFLPTIYNEELISTNKLALGHNYYANIIVYDFPNDSYKKLFDADVFIEPFSSPYYLSRYQQKSQRADWVFLFVKKEDYNQSGRIDDKDPTVLYAVAPTGEKLKQITSDSENVESIELYEKLGFGLIMFQRDADMDKTIRGEEKQYYYRKINLADLTLGKVIDIR